MATILIDPHPAHGHYNGSLRLANILKEYGHTVIYIGVPEYKGKIEREGYQFYSMVYLNNGIIKEDFLPYWFDCFISFFNNALLKKFLQKSKQYDALIEKVKPDLILLDVIQIQKTVVYGKYNIRVIGFDTEVASCYGPNVPPYFLTYIPRHHFLSKIYVDWLWFRYDFLKLYRISLFNKMLFFGSNLYSIYCKVAKINHVSLEKWRDVKMICTMKAMPKNLIQLILTPKSFDFPRPPKENIIYIEPYLNKRDELVFSERYLLIRDSIVELKKTHPCMKFIYVSLGTLSEGSPRREARFVRTLIKYCKKHKDHQIVFSAGNGFNISSLKSVPESLHIFNNLPQLDILKHCDLMITHGGMNSLTECILNEVPVIVYPMMVKANWDQNGNSARAVYHKIGVRGKISSMTPKSLRKNVEEICNRYEFYKENIKSMKSKLDLKNGAERAAAIIESFLK